MDKQKLFAALDARILETIDLGEFHQRLEGETLTILMNPPLPLVRPLRKIEDADERGLAYATLQIQDLTADEVRELYSKDAPFCEWLTGRILDLNRAYQAGREKKSATG